MSDESVHTALRSDAPLVLVEAPAGCGKTHQGADYARDVAVDRSNRLLILTHTHAACSVFAERTRGSGSRVEIRTIDSLIAHIATAYHLGLGLPADVPTWARRTRDGYRHVALRVAALLKRHPMIAAALAKRYPVVICDEHQDCSGDQHALGMAMLDQGARLRVFADAIAAGNADCPKLAAAVVTFMNDIGKGFSPSAFGDRFEMEVREGCTARSYCATIWMRKSDNQGENF
ncbi:MAG TPA: AAA family ATPase [Acetobacteraceae bacterium]|nr:AAA family ATPase [Acetobacteraceae bacterium]